MVAMRFENFGGMLPRLSNQLLPENMAAYVSNANLKSGELRGLRAPLQIHEFAGPDSYQRAARVPVPGDDPYWQAFRSKNADFYPSPITNDLYDRYLWLDDNGPGQPSTLMQNSFARMQAGDPAFPLGVEPAPMTGPTVTPAGGVGVAETRAYLYTYVNLFDEEGQPSAATTATGKVDDTWTIGGFVIPTDYADKGLDTIRIYRTITGASGTQFFRVADIPITTTSYADTRPSSTVAQEGLILQSTTWAPPEQMEGFLAMPNGFFAGWRGKDIFFSEPYRPWAWPVEYTLAVEYAVIDAGVIDQTFVGLTATAPALVSGSHPSFMSISKSAYAEPCVAAESIAQSPFGIFYASQNGLNLVSAAGLTPVTREAVLRMQWNAEYVLGLRCAAAFDGQYIGFSLPGKGFIFQPESREAGIIQMINFMDIDNIWTDPYTGDALIIADNKVYEWMHPNATFLAADWISKVFQFPKPLNFGALMVTLAPGANAITPLPDAPVDEDTIPIGGPWLDQSAIINYNLINGPTINGAPAWGAHAPGNGPPTATWPYWYGVEGGLDNQAIPPGPFCRVIVFADHTIVWNEFIQHKEVYKLPSGFKSDTWQIQIQTRVPVLNVQIAETAKELANA